MIPLRKLPGDGTGPDPPQHVPVRALNALNEVSARPPVKMRGLVPAWSEVGNASGVFRRRPGNPVH